jgi:hypothetical protein
MCRIECPSQFNHTTPSDIIEETRQLFLDISRVLDVYGWFLLERGENIYSKILRRLGFESWTL